MVSIGRGTAKMAQQADRRGSFTHYVGLNIPLQSANISVFIRPNQRKHKAMKPRDIRDKYNKIVQTWVNIFCNVIRTALPTKFLHT